MVFPLHWVISNLEMISSPWIAVHSIQTKLRVILCKGLGHQEIGAFEEDPWIQCHAGKGMTAYLPSGFSCAVGN